MGKDPVEIFKFILFAAVWLFPIAYLIAALKFAKSRKEEDLGPNVVPFPGPRQVAPPEKPHPFERLKRLALGRAKG